MTTPQGKSEAETMDDIFDQAIEELGDQESNGEEEEQPEDSAGIPENESDDRSDEDTDTSSDSDTSSAEPDESKQQAPKERDFSDLLPSEEEKQAEKERQRIRSAEGQFQSNAKALLLGDKDFDEFTPFLKKGVTEHLVRMVNEGEIDIEDVPEEAQERVTRKLEQLNPPEEKVDNSKEILVAQLKIISKEIADEDFPEYSKSLKSVLKLMPNANAEQLHRYAKMDAGITDAPQEKTAKVKVRPGRTKPKSGFDTRKAISLKDIEQASGADVAKWLMT